MPMLTLTLPGVVRAPNTVIIVKQSQVSEAAPRVRSVGAEQQNADEH